MGIEIQLKGVKTHNLQGVDAEFPINKVTAVTGVSGSGKSSLVFDSLFAESYGRYTESLSSFARQYLKSLPRPKMDSAVNLLPAVAVQQKRSQGQYRSTVATLTEINEYSREIFSHLGEVYCHDCNSLVSPATAQEIAETIWSLSASGMVLVLGSLTPWAGMKVAQLRAELEIQGFTRVLIDGEVVRIKDLKISKIRDTLLVVDRLRISEENRDRALSSIELAFKVGRGDIAISIDGAISHYSRSYHCMACDIRYQPPAGPLFNHNHPSGACSKCNGFGRVALLDFDKVIPDLDASIHSRGVRPWNFGSHSRYYRQAENSAKSVGLDIKKIFRDYTKEDWDWLRFGKKGTGFTGVEGYLAYLDRKKYRAHYRIHASRFRSYHTCDRCSGARLRKEALAIKVNGRSIGDISLLSVKEFSQFLKVLRNQVRDGSSEVAKLNSAIRDATEMVAYLEDVGLGYLCLNRSSNTLSGGELQRIQMARSLGSGLTGTLYCLDEPSSGLHPRDCQRLIRVIHAIKERGNTVVMVEHEKSLIDCADLVVVVGPGAGADGGQICKNNIDTPQGFPELKDSYVDTGQLMTIRGVKTHNLQDVTVDFPLGCLSVVTGVSGSGKSSLVRHSLYPALMASAGLSIDVDVEGSWDSFECSAKEVPSVQLVGQEGIGRSSRSNMATYLGVYAQIRKIFADQPRAQGLGLTAGAFSFNVSGGRCEHCKGMGEVTEELSFLGEVTVVCQECGGNRFTEEVLSVRYRKQNLLDVLAMTAAKAREFFFDQPKVVSILDDVIAIGLGYITLGQSTSSFSGGEAQRLKLLSTLNEKPGEDLKVLLLDEPTTGLSDADVLVLLKQLRAIIDKGHTVIVVEHHLGVVSSADWLVDIGPEAGDAGGQVVYMGPTKGLLEVEESRTRLFLSEAWR